MLGLTVQNFLSAGVGIVVAVALVRGIANRSSRSLGNFYSTWSARSSTCWGRSRSSARSCSSRRARSRTSRTTSRPTASAASRRLIAMGPVASQEAIKMLGTNGGGFFNVNSAHPFENPNGFTNFFEMLLVLSIPGALVFMYGKMVGSRRQALAVFATMFVMFFGAVVVAYAAEAHGSPAQHAAGIVTASRAGTTGGNLEGKEQRFGIAGSALFDVVTTVTSCGAVNSSIESYTGLGGAVPFANLSASEVIFGGVGTGLYSILLYVLLAVFLGGLMVGRTPEYLGKKIEAKEIKLVALGRTDHAAERALLHRARDRQRRRASVDLVSRRRPSGLLGELLRLPLAGQQQRLRVRRLHRPDPAQRRQHRLARRHLRRSARRFDMLFARYAPILFALAVAGALAGKRTSPAGLGTMRTDNPTFVVLLIGVIILVGALTFFPALLLGPVVQALTPHLY